MNRRDLLKMISAATGTAMIGGNAALLSGCSNGGEAPPVPEKLLKYEFTERDIQILDEAAETFIPRTDTPGAKDAEVGAFMARFVNACYTPEEQAVFLTTMPQLEQRSDAEFSRSFVDLDTEQREAVLGAFAEEARERRRRDDPDPHFYTMLKQLTLFGFFTSELGATEVLRYIAIPGRYEGCTPYEEGDRAWAT